MTALSNIFVGLSLIFSMTEPATFAQKPDPETATANMVGASEVVPVFFDPGMKSLTKEEKGELQAMLTLVREDKKIEDVKVLAWGDREYPSKGEKAPAKQVALAEARAEVIKKYIQEELKVDKVETHNMAERPSKFEEMFKTADYQVKKSAEATGAAPTKKSVGFFEEMGRSTTALVLISTK